MEKTFPNKGILEKTNKRREELDFFYTVVNKVETLNKS
jgi:hypothetical protein